MAMEVQKEKMHEDIVRKAANNKDKQAYIHPSEYGYMRNSDGTKLCCKDLSGLSEIKSIEVLGKDFLNIILW